MATMVEVKVQVQDIVNQVRELNKKAQNFGMNLAADIGAAGRARIYPTYLNRPYNMRAGRTKQHDLMNPKWALKRGKPFIVHPKQGRLDSLGRRLVGFSLENKRPDLKVAYFASFAMNAYENDVYYHRGPRAGRLMRVGTHLFADRFPQELENVVPNEVAKFQRKLDLAIAEWNNRQ